MTQETTRKFVGRTIVIDPKTGEDSEYSAYVCILLTGAAGIPSVTVCEAPTIDELLLKLRTCDIIPHFTHAKLTFEPPPSHWPISHSMARQRYEALTLSELHRAQTVLSGR
jgi:hypothetical protein